MDGEDNVLDSVPVPELVNERYRVRLERQALFLNRRKYPEVKMCVARLVRRDVLEAMEIVFSRQRDHHHSVHTLASKEPTTQFNLRNTDGHIGDVRDEH